MKMLRALIRVRISSMFSSMFGKRKSSGKNGGGAAMTAITAFAYLIIMASMFMMMYPVGSVLFEADNGAIYFSLYALIAFALMFVGSIFMTQTQLFEANDNDLLLSMPIPPGYILASRLISLAFLDLAYCFIVAIPMFIIYCIFGSVSVLGIVSFLILTLSLPFISMAVTVLFAWLLSAITSHVRRKTAFKMAINIALVAAWFALYMNLSNIFTGITGGGFAPILNFFLIKWFSYAIAAENIPYALYFVLFSIGVFAAVTLALSLNFIRIVTKNKGTPKAVYKAKRSKTAGLGAALLRREMSRFISSSAYMMNCGLGVVFIIAVAVFTVIRSSEGVVLDIGSGETLNLAPLFAYAILFCQCVTLVSAPSVSLEGNSLWIAQSIPVKGADIIRAKLRLHLIITLPATIISSVVVAVVCRADALLSVFTVVAPAVMCIFIALLGVCMNLRFPRFEWTDETAVIKRGAAVGITMGIGYAVIFLPMLVFLIFVFAGASAGTIIGFLRVFSIVFPIILAISSALMYNHIIRRGDEIFAALGQ